MVATAPMMADQKGKFMEVVEIKNNKIYSTSTLCDRNDTFEILDKIPVGFSGVRFPGLLLPNFGKI